MKMINRFKKYWKKKLRSVNYELKYIKLKEECEKLKETIKELEKKQEENYLMARNEYLEKVIKRKTEIIKNLRNDNKRLMEKSKKSNLHKKAQ